MSEVPRIYALGHSTRSFAELVELLRHSGVVTLVDVRRFPRSRTNPQFNRETLAHTLPTEGIRYVHLPRLGGRRPSAGLASPNTAWRNLGFRGYADYMQTEEFAAGLDELLALAASGPVAIMCAEAVPWRCHRSLIADALFARGIVVQHIQNEHRATPHQITPFARVTDGRVTYPGDDSAPPNEPSTEQSTTGREAV